MELTLDDIHFGTCPVVTKEGYRHFIMCCLRQVGTLDRGTLYKDRVLCGGGKTVLACVIQLVLMHYVHEHAHTGEPRHPPPLARLMERVTPPLRKGMLQDEDLS